MDILKVEYLDYTQTLNLELRVEKIEEVSFETNIYNVHTLQEDYRLYITMLLNLNCTLI